MEALAAMSESRTEGKEDASAEEPEKRGSAYLDLPNVTVEETAALCAPGAASSSSSALAVPEKKKAGALMEQIPISVIEQAEGDLKKVPTHLARVTPKEQVEDQMMVAGQAPRDFMLPITPVTAAFSLRKIPTNVMCEEDYVDALDTIIERDYFPDLPRLRAQHAYLEALNNNDHGKASVLRHQIAQLTPATPRLMTPGPGGDYDSLMMAVEGQRPADYVTRTLVDGREVEVKLGSLDSFQGKYTSEDNAAFEEIVRRDKEEKAKKTAWIDEGARRHNLAVMDAREQWKKSGGTKCLPDFAYQQFEGRNSLVFRHPEPPPSVGQNLRIGPGKKAQINKKNARFPTALQEGAPVDPQLKRRKFLEERARDEDEMDDMVAAGDFSRKAGGMTPGMPGASSSSTSRGFVHTPMIEPGVDASPMMTYGEILSTPLLLPDATPGPAFAVPEAPRRDEVAHKLAEQTSKRSSARMKAISSLKQKLKGPASFMTNAKGKTSRGTPGLTPGLSSRGQTPFLSQKGTPASGSVRGTPLTAGGRTPGMTPGMTPQQVAAGEAELQKRLHAIDKEKRRRGEPTSQASLPSGLTDGLLNIF